MSREEWARRSLCHRTVDTPESFPPNNTLHPYTTHQDPSRSSSPERDVTHGSLAPDTVVTDRIKDRSSYSVLHRPRSGPNTLVVGEGVRSSGGPWIPWKHQPAVQHTGDDDETEQRSTGTSRGQTPTTVHPETQKVSLGCRDDRRSSTVSTTKKE